MTEKEQLQKEIELLIKRIELLQGNNSLPSPQINPYREENFRIEHYLSEITSRQGVLLTLAGLLSLLPILTPESSEYFFSWSLPLLIIAIVSYIFSSKRINFVSKEHPEPLDPLEINFLLKETYHATLKFHKLADISICSFLTSFIISQYFIIYQIPLHIWISCIIFLISLLIGLLRFFYISSSEKKWVQYEILGGPTH